jgi:hypothetical protein
MTMKSTEGFKKVIEEYLKQRANTDQLFAVTFAKANKNIDDCITYIINTVQESGCNGFEDSEIFSMAVHYYDEDDIKVGEKRSCTVVTNHKVDLTPEEIEQAKKDARVAILEEEREALKRKVIPVKTPKINKKETHQLALKI